MLVLSSRQVWHDIFYTYSGDMHAPRVQTSPVQRYPEYRRGAKQIIDRLPPKLNVWGHYCFNPQIDAVAADKEKFEELVRVYLVASARKEFAKESLLKTVTDPKFKRLVRLAIHAIREVRFQNPVDTSGKKEGDLYTKSQLEKVAGCGERNFDRDCGDQWTWLTGTLDSWIGEALAPLSKWVEQQKEMKQTA